MSSGVQRMLKLELHDAQELIFDAVELLLYVLEGSGSHQQLRGQWWQERRRILLQLVQETLTLMNHGSILEQLPEWLQHGLERLQRIRHHEAEVSKVWKTKNKMNEAHTKSRCITQMLEVTYTRMKRDTCLQGKLSEAQIKMLLSELSS